MPTPLFEKGHPPLPGCGRPKGSTDKKWNNLNWWYSLIVDNMDDLTAEQRRELGKWGMTTLIGKLKSIPGSPEESVEAVESDLQALQAFHKPLIAPVRTPEEILSQTPTKD